MATKRKTVALKISTPEPKKRMPLDVKWRLMTNQVDCQVTLTLPNDLVVEALALLKDRGMELSDYVRASLRSLPQRMQFYGLDSPMPIGKYKGEKLETIIRLDSRYVLWLVKNVETFSMKNECYDLIDALTEKAS